MSIHKYAAGPVDLAAIGAAKLRKPEVAFDLASGPDQTVVVLRAPAPKLDWHVCDTCEGSGEIIGMTCTGGQPFETEMECPDCGGRGSDVPKDVAAAAIDAFMKIEPQPDLGEETLFISAVLAAAHVLVAAAEEEGR